MNLNEARYKAGSTFKRTNKIETIQIGIDRANSKARNKRKFSESDVTSGAPKWKHSSNAGTTTVTNTTSDCTLENTGVIMAITEGRGEATYEVGIAVMNINLAELILIQISDTQNYLKVLRKINLLNPIEIVIPRTITSSRLVDILKENFPNVTIVATPRGFFNKAGGLMQVQKLCAPAWNSVFLVLQQKYYALTATGALMAYLESYKHIYCAKNSIKVDYQESESNMIIDVCAAAKLELVACAVPEAANAKYSSLRGILNHCLTNIGKRTLRANILQPPCNLKEIENRLNVVEYFYSHPQQLDTFQECIRSLSRIDQILSLATSIDDKSQHGAVRHLNYILQLNVFLNNLEDLQELVAASKLDFFIQLGAILNNNDLMELKEIFEGIIEPGMKPAVGTKAVHERCFAIKVGYCELLDIYRKKYSEKINEMKVYVDNIAEEYKLSLQLSNNTTKGYHISMKLTSAQRNTFKKTSLPPAFIYVNQEATVVTMKTLDLITLTQRLEDTEQAILQVSNTLIQEVLIKVQLRIARFYDLCEILAKLDMLQAFAKAASSAGKYVRPKFGNSTNITNGRHPLLNLLRETDPTANDILCNEKYKMHIITGPNGSGKSIYLRQIALLQIMAQIGSFVPADKATFRICDRILARIHFDDNMECGASTFVVEMKDIQYFLNVITDNTLVIMDELCRSTSVEEGTALAMAICEEFMTTKAFVFVATHFTYLVKLRELNSNVRCWQLETKEEIRPNSRKPLLDFTYRVIPGVTSLESYALALAAGCWPQLVMEDVEYVLTQIPRSYMDSSVDKKQKMKISFENELLHLKDQGKCTVTNVTKKLLEFKKRFLEEFKENPEQSTCKIDDKEPTPKEGEAQNEEEISNKNSPLVEVNETLYVTASSSICNTTSLLNETTNKVEKSFDEGTKLVYSDSNDTRNFQELSKVIGNASRLTDRSHVIGKPLEEFKKPIFAKVENRYVEENKDEQRTELIEVPENNTIEIEMVQNNEPEEDNIMNLEGNNPENNSVEIEMSQNIELDEDNIMNMEGNNPIVEKLSFRTSEKISESEKKSSTDLIGPSSEKSKSSQEILHSSNIPSSEMMLNNGSVIGENFPFGSQSQNDNFLENMDVGGENYDNNYDIFKDATNPFMDIDENECQDPNLDFETAQETVTNQMNKSSFSSKHSLDFIDKITPKKGIFESVTNANFNGSLSNESTHKFPIGVSPNENRSINFHNKSNKFESSLVRSHSTAKIPNRSYVHSQNNITFNRSRSDSQKSRFVSSSKVAYQRTDTTSEVNTEIFKAGIRNKITSTPRTTERMALKPKLQRDTFDSSLPPPAAHNEENAMNLTMQSTSSQQFMRGLKTGDRFRTSTPIMDEADISISYSPKTSIAKLDANEKVDCLLSHSIPDLRIREEFEKENEKEFNDPSTSSGAKPRAKFRAPLKPINKLSKKKIQQSLETQRQQILAKNLTVNECVEQLLSLPSVRQIKQSTVLGTVNISASGVVHMENQDTGCNKRKKFKAPFKPFAKNVGAFDCTIFSDARANDFERLMNGESSSNTS